MSSYNFNDIIELFKKNHSVIKKLDWAHNIFVTKYKHEVVIYVYRNEIVWNVQYLDHRRHKGQKYISFAEAFELLSPEAKKIIALNMDLFL